MWLYTWSRHGLCAMMEEEGKAEKHRIKCSTFRPWVLEVWGSFTVQWTLFIHSRLPSYNCSRICKKEISAGWQNLFKAIAAHNWYKIPEQSALKMRFSAIQTPTPSTLFLYSNKVWLLSSITWIFPSPTQIRLCFKRSYEFSTQIMWETFLMPIWFYWCLPGYYSNR